MSWRQVELAKNAHEISERGTELYKRFLKFTEHFEKVGKGLQTAMGGYNAAVGSLERQVFPAARKMRELQGESTDDLKALELKEESPRSLVLSSDDEQA
jgi:DNA recombination protein RmuC